MIVCKGVMVCSVGVLYSVPTDGSVGMLRRAKSSSRSMGMSPVYAVTIACCGLLSVP